MYYQILIASLTHFSIKGWENVLFEHLLKQATAHLNQCDVTPALDFLDERDRSLPGNRDRGQKRDVGVQKLPDGLNKRFAEQLHFPDLVDDYDWLGVTAFLGIQQHGQLETIRPGTELMGRNGREMQLGKFKNSDHTGFTS